jgi:hypothetical protein
MSAGATLSRPLRLTRPRAHEILRGVTRFLTAAVLALTLLTACGSDEPDVPAYLTQVHRTLAGTDYAFVGDDQLVTLGRTICQGIGAGLTRERLGQASSLPAPVLQAILDASTAHLCPEHKGF